MALWSIDWLNNYFNIVIAWIIIIIIIIIFFFFFLTLGSIDPEG